MNITNEELILLVSILGSVSNTDVNKANDVFSKVYHLGENYVKPVEEKGLNTPSDLLWKKLMNEATERNIIKPNQLYI